MNNLIFLLQKEFRQIFRDPTILKMIMIMPIIQLIILPLASDFEVKNVRIGIVDHDHSVYSQRLIQKIEASEYFKIEETNTLYTNALKSTGEGKVDLILTIPINFEKDLIKESEAKVHLAADAVNGIKGGLGSAYAAQIIGDFNREIREEWFVIPRFNPIPIIDITSASWYNPSYSYNLFMVPGILVVLVTLIGAFLTALNIVAEKEAGTIEQINVTPIKKYEFVLGKLLPFWVLGMVSITIGMTVAYIIFGLIPKGSFFTIYAFSAIYLFSVLGIGLLISTFADNQQQATLFAFFSMMIFVMLSGLFTPIESMPDWSKMLTKINPPSYFISVMRAVYIKGSRFTDLLPSFFSLLGLAVFFNALAILNYRKRSV
jgi:ABC-2 type transport system permease protein